MPTGFRLFDPATGRVKRTTTTACGIVFSKLVIGGVGAAQDGSISDARFLQGDPFYMTLRGSFFNARENYQPVLSISGSTLSWHFPQADGSVSRYRPSISYLYGVR